MDSDDEFVFSSQNKRTNSVFSSDLEEEDEVREITASSNSCAPVSLIVPSTSTLSRTQVDLAVPSTSSGSCAPSGLTVPSTSTAIDDGVLVSTATTPSRINTAARRKPQSKRSRLDTNNTYSLTYAQLIEKKSKDQLIYQFRNQMTDTEQQILKISGDKRIKSNVWNLFEIIFDKSTEDKKIISNYVRCSSCFKFYAYNGETTTSLLRHRGCGKEQPSIRSFMAKPAAVKQIDISNIKDASIKFIVKDLRPYAAIEGEGLIELCQKMVELGQKFPTLSHDEVKKIMPSRNTLASEVMKRSDEFCKQVSIEIRCSIDSYGGFSCTSDLWTDNFKRKSYLCLSVHLNSFQNGKIVPKMYLISMNAMKDEPKTGHAIFSEIKEVFQKFGVSENELLSKVTFVTDRGGNIKSALTNFTRLNCYAHIMNNIVQHMCKLEIIKDLISKAAALVRYIKISGLNDNKQLVSSLKSYCETRFNTVVDMFESIERNYYGILNILQEKQRTAKNNQTNLLTKITCLDPIVLKTIANFLMLFKELTTDIEGDKYVTIIKVWPAYLKISRHLMFNENDEPYIKAMKAEGQKYIAERKASIEPDIVHKLSVFLHPALKSLSFAEPEERQKIYSYARLKIANNGPIQDENGNVSSNLGAAGTRKNKNKSLFEEFLDNVDLEESIQPNMSDEIQYYIDLKIQKIKDIENFDVSNWWAENRKSLPGLFKLFMANSCTPATSCTSERAFSGTSNTITAKRSQLLPDNVNALAQLSNMYKRNNI